MDLVVEMVEHHLWLVDQLLDRAGRLSDEQLDRPVQLSVDGIDRDPTLRSLLARLVGQLAQWMAWVNLQPYDFSQENGVGIEVLQARLEDAGPAFLAQIREVCGQSRLNETFVDVSCDPPRVSTYGGMIAHVLTFAAHRRTLATGALTDFGVGDLGHGDPLPWLAGSR